MDLLRRTKGGKTTGVTNRQGEWVPAHVTYTVGFLGEGVRGNVC
ncbi:hypothetical protein GCM10010230_24480 [Streptomyces narbonensis]|nr:hypothetical protein GCM10010230_24480 [Streptomyces narbonensis]